MGETDMCVVCRRRPPDHGHVCGIDLQSLSTQLAQLPHQLTRLAAELTPGAGPPPGERVAAARAAANPAARLDVLNLLAGGSDAVAAAGMAGLLNPHVRRWRTVEMVAVDGGDPVEIVTWHQELVDAGQVSYSSTRGGVHKHVVHADPDAGGAWPILHDDQVGLVPPAAWAHSWARWWQQRLGHQPQRVLRQRHARGWPKGPSAAIEALGRLQDEQAVEAHNRHVRQQLGLQDYTPHAQRPPDPLGMAWQGRFGPAERGFALGQDVRYLLAWLDEACRRNLDMPRFAGELRALCAELSTALGDRPDQQWLGRCPAMLTSVETGKTHACGAGIWQDPFAAVVECRRCRSTWGPERVELLKLAGRIRKVWPLDRRRCYTAVERRLQPQVRPVRCPACANPVHIDWREVTAPGDVTRFWQPTKVRCPHGCGEAGRLL